MTRRRMEVKNGYTVIAIPDSGLFIKDNRIVTGHNTEMQFEELILFARRADAEGHAEKQQDYWKRGDQKGHNWNFKVIPVLVSERL